MKLTKIHSVFNNKHIHLETAFFDYLCFLCLIFTFVWKIEKHEGSKHFFTSMYVFVNYPFLGNDNNGWILKTDEICVGDQRVVTKYIMNDFMSTSAAALLTTSTCWAQCSTLLIFTTLTKRLTKSLTIAELWLYSHLLAQLHSYNHQFQ